MSDSSDDDDKFISGMQRKAAFRLVLLGLAIVAVGAMFIGYGRHYAEMQENSQVQFALPDIMKIAGMVGAFIGGVLTAVGIVRRIRA
jgi:hypothetical protein